MVGRINITVPFACQFAGLTWYRPRRAGFCFTNHATFLVCENVGKEMNEIVEWSQKNQMQYFAEMLWAAYLAWCFENSKLPKFKKKELLDGFNRLPKDEQKRVVKTWNDATTIGAKQIKAKKKR